MPKQELDLTDRQQELIQALVRSGEFEDANAVFAEGLRLLEAAKLTALREAAALGIADMEAGRYREFESVGDLVAHLDGLAREVASRRE